MNKKRKREISKASYYYRHRQEQIEDAKKRYRLSITLWNLLTKEEQIKNMLDYTNENLDIIQPLDIPLKELRKVKELVRQTKRVKKYGTKM